MASQERAAGIYSRMEKGGSINQKAITSSRGGLPTSGHHHVEEATFHPHRGVGALQATGTARRIYLASCLDGGGKALNTHDSAARARTHAHCCQSAQR
eukprot:430713-Amphidinium_carterae.1